MRNTLLLFGILSVMSLCAQNGEWLEDVQHSNKVNLKDYDNNSNYRWNKHLQRYLWKEKNSYDDNGKYVSQNERLKSFQKKQISNRSANTTGNWTPIGLTEWSNGSSGYNPGNGRINAISVDPNNPQIIYACAASGGLWKSNNGGDSWNCITDDFPVLGTSDIAIDPNNSDILYLGTGDRDGLDTYGVGIYKSTDGGSSWNPTGLYSIYDSESLIVNCIEIDENQSNVIFAGTNAGLYKSVDSGVNWEQIISGKTMEIKINPENSNTVFAVNSNKFKRSHDGGETFSTISNGLQTSIGRMAMDITPADSSYIYLIIADGASNFNGVFQSTDGGSSFTKKIGIDQINLLGYAQDGNDDDSQAWYDLAIAVSKTNKNRIYTGGINVWTSGNGGSSWNISSHWYYVGNNDTYSHADIHSLDIYGETLYCGSDGGAFKYTSSNDWENISNGLNISQIYKFSNSTDGSKISTGCQDNGTNVSNNGVWEHVLGADGMATVINKSNPQIVYLSSQNGSFRKSTSGGDNNYHIFSPGDYGESGIWVTPIAISESQPNTLVIGLENVFRTQNGGNSWNQISSFSDGENFNVVAIAPSNPDYIYGAKDNHLYFTWDGGNTWQESTNPFVEPVADIAIDNDDPTNVYFLKSSSYTKIYHSTDGGLTFSTIHSSITQTQGFSIELENNSTNGIYIGTEFGVYYTNDLLSEWISYSDQMPIVSVRDLEIADGKIRAATYGRGVWESDLYYHNVGIKEDKKFLGLKLYPNPSEELITIESSEFEISNISLFNSSGVYLESFTGSDKQYSIQHLVEGQYFVRIEANTGEVYVKTFIKQ